MVVEPSHGGLHAYWVCASHPYALSLGMSASKVCSARTPFGSCPNLQPCDEHPKTAWSGSQRRAKTLSGWEQQRRAQRILRDPKHCDDDGFPLCHVCGLPGADQVDHVVPLSEDGEDIDANLAPIHSRPCHERKTADEAARARARNPRGGTPKF